MMPKLLLADDSITVQRVIALTFQGEGIEVIAVGDGDQAVDAIDRERPQIVLADLSMPGRDGYAVAEYVKRSPELSKDIRVVLLTGAAEPVEEARSRALGIDGVLSKPFEPHVATALVRRLLTEAPTVPGFREAEAGRGVEAAAPAAAPAAAAGSTGDGVSTIAVDDYFRRLDEALATAGLSTAPEPAGDLAAIAGPPGHAADRSGDAETVVVPRPAAVAGAARPAEADEPGEASKLVDAFSALLAAEEDDGNPMVAGPVEMEGAPAPVPPPAVEWTPGQTAAAPIEAAAETVALQARVVAEAAEAAASETVAAAPEPATAAEALSAEPPMPGAMLAETEPATAEAEAEPSVPAPALAAVREVSASPAALRADAPGHAVLDGIDLDTFADAVAQKILHRLTDARIDAIVSERVLEIAERLVREEIDRIKADAQ
jgi:CheY-like chemotaxis protein